MINIIFCLLIILSNLTIPCDSNLRLKNRTNLIGTKVPWNINEEESWRNENHNFGKISNKQDVDVFVQITKNTLYHKAQRHNQELQPCKNKKLLPYALTNNYTLLHAIAHDGDTIKNSPYSIKENHKIFKRTWF